jgi:hypothetical protein
MKTGRMSFCVLVPILAIVVLGGCAPAKYVPKENEEIYGTWVNLDAGRQKLLEQPGTWKLFIYVDDAQPSESGACQLVKKWKDAAVNTWYWVNLSQLGGAVPSGNRQGLVKIDATGKTLEISSLDIGAFDNKTYPKVIDTKNDSYGIYHRSE